MYCFLFTNKVEDHQGQFLNVANLISSKQTNKSISCFKKNKKKAQNLLEKERKIKIKNLNKALKNGTKIIDC